MNEKRTIRARIVENLAARMEEYFGPEEMADAGEGEKRYHRIFCEAVQGKVVELVFIGDDAFEKVDNNTWIPSHLWTEVACDHPVEATGSRAERDIYCEWLRDRFSGNADTV